MAQQTAVSWLIDKIVDQIYTVNSQDELVKIFEKSKQMEKEQTVKAMMHALDEDGHTGEWKIKFVENYYNNTHKNN